MKYLSLFSGIGGFEKGIGDNHECVGFSEIDKYPIQIYQKHFPTHKNYGDITKINERSVPDFELICGGFPCQSFSIAGKRKGFEDTRGTLFFDIARIINHKRPRLIFLENVKGLLNHEEGRTFSRIISVLDGMGYDLQWQVLNSKNFGVPQNRERVFIVGHLRGTARPKVFPIGGENKDSVEELTPSENIVIGSSQKHSAISDNIVPTLSMAMGQGGGQTPMVAKTVRSGGRASPHGAKQNWDSYEVEGKIRRLTPKECERLQGFPDGWTEGVSDTQRYKCLGNAVTTTVIKAIFELIHTIH